MGPEEYAEAFGRVCQEDERHINELFVLVDEGVLKASSNTDWEEEYLNAFRDSELKERMSSWPELVRDRGTMLISADDYWARMNDITPDLPMEVRARRRIDIEGIVTRNALIGKVWKLSAARDLMNSALALSMLKFHSVAKKARQGLAPAAEVWNAVGGADQTDSIFHHIRAVWFDNQLHLHTDLPNFLRPSRGLAYRLMATDVKGVRGTDLEMPFPAFIIFLPEKMLGMHYANSGMHWATHVKVGVEESTIPGMRVLQWRTEHDSGERSPHSYDFAYSASSCLLCEHDLRAPGMTGTFKTHIDFQIGSKRVDYNAFHAFIRNYVVNTLLFLTSGKDGLRLENQAELDKAKVKAKAKNARKTDKARYSKLRSLSTTYDYGTTVTVNENIERHVITGSNKKSKQELRYRTIVRGHWRNQAHGPAHTYRKLIWIEPHIRGSEDFGDKVVSHTYTMGN
jgi:hypothetical protein